jgi:hypothetical protein
MNDLGLLPLVLKVLDVDPLPFVKLSIGIRKYVKILVLDEVLIVDTIPKKLIHEL